MVEKIDHKEWLEILAERSKLMDLWETRSCGDGETIIALNFESRIAAIDHYLKSVGRPNFRLTRTEEECAQQVASQGRVLMRVKIK